jgi:hypothetical protein
VLDDGRRVVIKWSDPQTDLAARLDESAEGRELRLWETGVLDHLPTGLSHAILAAGRVGGEVVTVMHDLGPHVLSWDVRLTPPDLRRVFGAVASLHTAFRGQPPPGLCPLTTRLSLFAPERIQKQLGTGNPLPSLVLRGWELFEDMVSHDVAAEVFDTLARPERLTHALAGSPHTLLHGDLWLVNVALGLEDVVLLDWSLATAGPAVLDFVTFTVGGASHVMLPREALIQEIRAACGADHDEKVLRAALFCGLGELGWNKALDAAEHPDLAMRASQRAELDWWVARAREALESGLIV